MRISMRTTIYLDEDLHDRLTRLVPPRGMSRFINEALEEKVHALEREELEREMVEGYVATRQERAALNADWSSVDVEGWPA
jgi:hypothetical protein